VAAFGLILGRVGSTTVSGLMNRMMPGSPMLARWSGVITAGVSSWAIYAIGNQRWAPGVWKRNRDLLALGAGLHVVEEVLGIVLAAMRPSLPAWLSTALYGDGLGGQANGLGVCQTGCDFPPGWLPPGPCAMPPGGQQLTPNVAGFDGGYGVGGLGACQVGCQWPQGPNCVTPPGGSTWTGQPPMVVPPTPGASAPTPGATVPGGGLPGTLLGMGLAGDLALGKAGEAGRDPFIADLLVKKSNRAQQILDSVGMGQQN